jgi:minor extracellular serine protease Vpr
MAMTQRACAWVLAPVVALSGVLVLLLGSPSSASAADEDTLHLVTLAGGGVGARTGQDAALARELIRRRQDRTLGAVGADEPVYRWSDALNGYAVRLTPAQAAELEAAPDVLTVEPATRRPLAAAPAAPVSPVSPVSPGSAYATGRGGQGVVVGLVDSGLHPEGPLFSSTPGLGARPRDFDGECTTGADWPRRACNGKVLAAQYFVAGFGESHLRSSARVSPRDDVGHGTQVASIAAGNAGVSVDLAGEDGGTYSGVAPRARLAVYKACWTAPDPADDGCSTADLVAAIDAAVGDGVDVLNVSVTGTGELDTVERALLGAAEADVVVVTAAGNQGGTAGHASPWVTTVGSSAGVPRRGRVVLTDDGPDLEGAMLSRRRGPTTRILLAGDAAAPGRSRSDARVCRPGSLDSAQVSDAIVVCARGGSLGRIDKSHAVDRADGAGMVLTNGADGPGGTVADLHAVPTVHLDREASAELRSWLADHPGARARLRPVIDAERVARVAAWSPSGDPAGPVAKPDLVAPARGILGGVPPEVRSTRWEFLTGSSAASAQVSGLAAVVRSRRDWSAAEVRSALSTVAEPIRARVLRAGAGEATTRAPRAGLTFPVGAGAYRAYVRGRLASRSLNTPSVALGDRHGVVRRTVVNRSGERRTWQSVVRGIERHDVQVRPASFTLAPGESQRIRVRASGPDVVHPVDDGMILLRAPGVPDTRVPILLGR